MAYGPTMNKGERDELRRLLRAQIKVLKGDIEARQAELEVELESDVEREFAARDREYDAAMFRVNQVADEANRAVNDIGRQLWGEAWGVQHDRRLVTVSPPSKPGVTERRERLHKGRLDIERKVADAKRQLLRLENDLLTELATSALESAEAKAFFARIPKVTELVPSYRMQQIADR